MDGSKLTRRSALGLLVAGVALSACEKKDRLVCTDTTGLTPTDIQLRTTQEYVDRSPFPDKRCNNCTHFDDKGPRQCGGCRVLKGPVHPVGYCRLWALRQGA